MALRRTASTRHQREAAVDPVAPCVLWGSPPALPNVHIIEVLPECGVLATASDAGVVLWQLPTGSDGSSELRPYALLFPPSLGGGGGGGGGGGRLGGGDVVTALAGCAHGPGEPSCIATAAASGSLCVWHASTGGCLRASADVIGFAATCMQTLPDRRFVLCAGQACDLALVDLRRMAVVHRLHGHRNWVERATVHRMALDGDPAASGVSMSALAVSVCRDGALRVWDLAHERGAADDGGSYVAARGRSHLRLPEAERGEAVRVSSLHLSTDGAALLVVTEACARLFGCDAGEPGQCRLQCVGSFALPGTAPALAGGSILCGSKQPWRIALWTADGLAAVYEPPSAAGEQGARAAGRGGGELLHCGEIVEIQPIVQCALSTDEPGSAAPASGERVRTAASSGGRLLASAWATGQVVVWAIAEFAWSPPDEVEMSNVCQTWATGAVEDGWAGGPSAPAAPAPPGPAREVSAATIAAEAKEWPLFSVRGHTDGTVVISTLPADPAPLELALHSGAVTEVKLFAQDSPSRLLLLSCSRDGSLCFWDVGQRNLLATSRHHRGAITSLHTPPCSSRGTVLPAVRILGPHVCSVGEDNCVCVHTLGEADIQCTRVFGGHPSAITAVGWGSDDDSLLVQSLDGTLSIWLLESGMLERRLPAAACTGMMERFTHDQMEESGLLAATPAAGPGRASSRGVGQKRQAVRQAELKSRGCARNENRSGASDVPPLHVLEFDLLLLVDDIRQAKSSEKWPDATLPERFAAALSFLYPWGIDAELDRHLAGLQLSPPSVPIGLAVHGDHSAFTALFPSACALGSEMRRAVHLASSPALSLAILSAALLDVPGHSAFHDRLVQLYVHRVLQQGDGAVAATERLLISFMRHWLHASAEIRLASRGLFREVLSCLQQPQRRQLARHLSTSVERTCVRFRRMIAGEATFDQGSESLSKCYSFFCLCRLAVLDAETIPAADLSTLAQQITTLSLWRGDRPDHPLWLWRDYAVEVVGDGFGTWRQYISMDPPALVKKLVRSAFSHARAEPGQSDARQDRATDALVSIAVQEPQLVLQLVSEEALSTPAVDSHAPYGSNVAAVDLLQKMIVRKPAAMLEVLDDIARIIVSTMSPALPALRKSCLDASKRAIAAMTEAYPMVSFHRTTQRLAVGLVNSSIAIFDLNSARRLLTLRGHSSAVSAVSFGVDAKGLHVASYSAGERSTRCWHPAASNGHCLCSAAVEFEARGWSDVRLEWTATDSFQLVHAADGVLQVFGVTPIAGRGA